MEITDSLLLLRQSIERFVKLPDEDWSLLLPHIETKDFKKQQLFAIEGKRSVDVAFIISGSFRQFYTKAGGERTTYFYFAHDLMCSYVSCITGKPSLITLQALTDSVCLYFPYKVLLDLYRQSPAWQTFGRQMAEYIAMGLEERMVNLLIQTAEERYRALLTGSKKKIIEQIPQQYIASYLGITPVSMSRIRRRLLTK